MRGKRLVGAAALALALAAGVGGPAQAATAPAVPAVEDPWELELVKVTETGVTYPAREIVATCPAGKKAINGGSQNTHGFDPAFNSNSHVTADGTGWVLPQAYGQGVKGGTVPLTYTVYAVCACADKLR